MRKIQKKIEKNFLVRGGRVSKNPRGKSRGAKGGRKNCKGGKKDLKEKEDVLS